MRQTPGFRDVIAVLMVVSAACSFGADPTTTTRPPAATTTTEALPDVPPAEVTTTSLPPGVDPATAEANMGEVEALIDVAEDIRALDFLETPSVRMVDDPTIEAMVQDVALAPLEDPAFDVEQRLERLLGMHPDGFSARQMYRSYYETAPVAFFDAGSNTLNVAVREGGYSAFERSVIVGEVVRALATEYFEATVSIGGLVPVAPDDAALAVSALIEGDATYFQLLYLQGLPQEESAAASVEADALRWQPPAGTPRWLIERLAFPYDDGLVFVTQLVTAGGIARLDQAYALPPASTDEILNPERYLEGEAIEQVDEIRAQIPGYRTLGEGGFGHLAWRSLLASTLDDGLLTQTVDGWVDDAYLAVYDAGSVGLAIRLATRSEDDAIEYATALIALARERLAAGDGADVDGGILFDEGGPYVFIDRVDSDLVAVFSDSSLLGTSLKDALG